MATTPNYNFPLIAGTETVDIVGDQNALANAVDAALKQVADEAGAGSSYELPPATYSRLGGVKVGSGLNVEADGTLSTTGGGSSYVLPPATAYTLGGVKIGSGIDVSGDGTISVTGGGGTPGANSVGTTQLQNGAVTTEKLASAVQSSISNAQNTASTANTTADQALAATQQSATRGSIDDSPVGSGTVSVVYETHPLTKLTVVKFWFNNASFSNTSYVTVGTLPSQYRPMSQWEINVGQVSEQNITATVNANGTLACKATGAASGVIMTGIITYYAGI